MLKKEPKIVFHHIPKCGGTSIVSGLALTYYPYRLLKYRKQGFASHLNSRAASEVSAQLGINRYTYRRQLLSYFVEKGSTPFISGHYPFDENVYDRHKEDWNFVTLLRDPVARWYSEYFWNRYKNHDYQKTEVDIEAYIETQEGQMNARSFVNFLSHMDDNTSIPSQNDVNSAVLNLKKMRVVGILEELDIFKRDMKAVFGRKPIFWNRNSSPASQEQKILPDQNSDIHQKILEMTAADQEIYLKTKEMIKL